MKSLALVFVGIALAAAEGLAQQAPAPSTSPAFEVVSVKPSDPKSASPIGAFPIVLPHGNGRFSATNVPLRLLVRMAYGVEDFQIEGGPSWQMSQRFDIVAKAEDGFNAGQQAMMRWSRRCLPIEFKLKVHTETRDMPVSALVIASDQGKLGPHLKPSNSDCSNAQAEQQKLADAFAKGGLGAIAGMLPKPGERRPCSMTPMIGAEGFGMRADGQPLSAIIPLLTQVTGRIVKDKTGLTGALPPSDGPSLLTALREDLGLKLDSERGQVEMLVIDSAEMPEAN
jgi:uncharacterized protein (TIGR03435 family)